MKKALFLAAIALLPLVNNSVLAADAPVSCCGSMKDRSALTPAQFAQTVATVDMLEIKLGQVAQTNASLPSVKKFGAYMVKSHTEIAAALAKVAATEKIALPIKLDAKHQAIYNKLAALKGPAFDKVYIPAMVTGHTKVLSIFQCFDLCCKDPAFKKFAHQTTPIIAAHLKAAQKVQAEMTKAGLL